MLMKLVDVDRYKQDKFHQIDLQIRLNKVKLLFEIYICVFLGEIILKLNYKFKIGL